MKISIFEGENFRPKGEFPCAKKKILTCPTPPQRLFLNSLDSGDTFTYPQSVHWTRRTASRGALQKWTNEDLYDILKGKTVIYWGKSKMYSRKSNVCERKEATSRRIKCNYRGKVQHLRTDIAS